MLFLDSFEIQVNKKRIFDRIQCFEESENYERFVADYNCILPNVMDIIKAKAVIAIAPISKDMYQTADTKQKGSYVLSTLGNQIDEYVQELFQKDEYVQGIIADAMADDYLFQMDKELQKEIKKMCNEYYVHTVNRLEAPNNISIEIQKYGYEVCRGKELLNLKINESYMFDPIKTLLIVYELEDGRGECVLQHDCSKCNNFSCTARMNTPISVIVDRLGETHRYTYYGKDSLLTFFRKQNIYFSADCGGIGICGKCRIQLVSGKLEVSTSDIQFFSNEEIKQGYRLACKAYPKEDIRIKIEYAEEEMQILGVKDDSYIDEEQESYGIAIDIGTTTIAMALVSRVQKKIMKQYVGINHQREFGTDVITRIQAANDGFNKQLQKILKEDILQGILDITNDFEVDVNQIIMAGNTTMIHLLMNYSCEKLGTFPYQSNHLNEIDTNIEEMFQIKKDIPIFILPGITTFVGGDIVSGLYDLDYLNMQETSLFFDLGTNGELVLGNKEELICTSTAIGPAFEGGKVSSGVPSVKGAIFAVWKNDSTNDLEYKTIFNGKPIGLCGSGLIDALALMLDEKIMDETGLLKKAYFEDGYLICKEEDCNIRIKQKDIREIQLAKAAFLAGIETILNEYEKKRITNVYLAGGFGHGINIVNAKKIGLLPEDLEIEVVGNTSLQGAAKLLMKDTKQQKIDRRKILDLVKKAKKIELAENIHFQERYLENMYF
jgi:uncharacterized 2Fe-2S/4Fe-4S cluster protein (DUF4445 family)